MIEMSVGDKNVILAVEIKMYSSSLNHKNQRSIVLVN